MALGVHLALLGFYHRWEKPFTSPNILARHTLFKPILQMNKLRQNEVTCLKSHH